MATGENNHGHDHFFQFGIFSFGISGIGNLNAPSSKARQQVLLQ